MNAIEITNITKVFKIPREKKRTLIENIIGVIKNRMSYETLYALKDINLSVKKGETIGIIGLNGSGKTTLLRIIARLLEPTEGEVKTQGKIIPFLELGVGFQHELTAKENIFLYGIIMGLSRKEVEQKFDEIIEFAELKKFVDTPLINYSTGMQMRLAFATAMQMEGDIYLIDEALAVGDIKFQEKCIGAIEKLQKDEKTIVFVTQGLGLVKRLCSRVLLLHNGQQLYLGKPITAIKKYLELMGKNFESMDIKPEISPSQKAAEMESPKLLNLQNPEEKNVPKSSIGKGVKSLDGVKITGLEVINKKGEKSEEFKKNSTFIAKISYNASKEITNPYFGVAVHSKNGEILVGPNTFADKFKIKSIKGEGSVLCTFKKFPLKEGEYYVSATIHREDEREVYDFRNMAEKFIIFGEKKAYGIVDARHKWDVVK